MDFQLTQEQKDVQKAAIEFARGEFDPDLAKELDESGRFPEAILKKACDLGFIGIHYPEEFGGQGMDFFDNVLVTEAFCKIDSGIGSALTTVDLGSTCILEFGSREQKEEFLNPLAKGKMKMSVALGESVARKDFADFSTVATRAGKEYVVNGRKGSVFNGSLADAFLVLVKEPNEGWITLILEKNKISETTRVKKMGLKLIQFGELKFRETRIRFDRRLGNEGDGLLHVDHFYKESGLRSAAQGLGISLGAFERAVEYAKRREVFGKKLSDFQVIQHKLADIAVGIEVARCLTYKSAVEYDQGKLEPVSLAITQLEVGRRLFPMVYDAMQIFGGHGYMAEMDIEHYYRDAVMIGLDLGSEEDLKDIISKRNL